MPKRLYQSRFDEEFRPTVPLDVTPDDFTGLQFHKPEGLSRFVREVSARVYIRCPNDLAGCLVEKVFVPFEDLDQEEMWVLRFDNKLRITHEVMVYRGTVSRTHIREPELLKEAIRVNAPSLILSHCHPSGDPTPSREDVKVTEPVSKAARLLGVTVEDHIIVGEDSWISLKERGLGFA